MPSRPHTIPTKRDQIAQANSVMPQNPAAPLNPTPIAPNALRVDLPGSRPMSGVSQSQQALARPEGANTGVPMPEPARQQPPTSLEGLANTPQQVQTPSNIQQMIQRLGEAKISQNPITMQTILGMLGPQTMQPPPLGALMQPQRQEIQRPLQPGLPVRRG